MTQKFCIQGDPNRGADIIKFLEVVGGVNADDLNGNNDELFYFISGYGQGIFYEDEAPSGYTTIKIQPDSLFPEDWCCEKCDTVVNYLNEKFYADYTGDSNFYGQRKYVTTWSQNETWGLQLTPEQLEKLIALSEKEPQTMKHNGIKIENDEVLIMGYMWYADKMCLVLIRNKEGVNKAYTGKVAGLDMEFDLWYTVYHGHKFPVGPALMAIKESGTLTNPIYASLRAEDLVKENAPSAREEASENNGKNEAKTAVN